MRVLWLNVAMLLCLLVPVPLMAAQAPEAWAQDLVLLEDPVGDVSVRVPDLGPAVDAQSSLTVDLVRARVSMPTPVDIRFEVERAPYGASAADRSSGGDPRCTFVLASIDGVGSVAVEMDLPPTFTPDLNRRTRVYDLSPAGAVTQEETFPAPEETAPYTHAIDLPVSALLPVDAEPGPLSWTLVDMVCQQRSGVGLHFPPVVGFAGIEATDRAPGLPVALVAGDLESSVQPGELLRLPPEMSPSKTAIERPIAVAPTMWVPFLLADETSVVQVAAYASGGHVQVLEHRVVSTGVSDAATLWVRMPPGEPGDRWTLWAQGTGVRGAVSDVLGVRLGHGHAGTNEWHAYAFPRDSVTTRVEDASPAAWFPHFGEAPLPAELERPVCCVTAFSNSFAGTGTWTTTFAGPSIGVPLRLDPEHPPVLSIRLEGFPSEGEMRIDLVRSDGYLDRHRIATFTGPVPTGEQVDLVGMVPRQAPTLHGGTKLVAYFYDLPRPGTQIDLSETRLVFEASPALGFPPDAPAAAGLEQTTPFPGVAWFLCLGGLLVLSRRRA